MDLRVVLERLGIVSVEGIIRRQSPYKRVEQLMFTQRLSFSSVIEGEQRVVLQKTSLDRAQSLLLVLFVVRVVGVALNTISASPTTDGERDTHDLAIDCPIRVVLAEAIIYAERR